MAQASSTSGVGGLLLKQLSHPLKLRLALCTALIVAWQLAFVGPLSEDVTATTMRIGAERKRTATAREIDQLKDALKPHRELIGVGEDEHELMRRVIGRIRTSPLRLIDLKPDKPKDLGPFQAVGIQLSVDGRYADIDELLGWAEHASRLLRVDSIQLAPASRDPGRLTAKIVLFALIDRTTPSVKTKSASGKSK